MSRLDRHVSQVRNKLAMRSFVILMAWAVFFAACAVALGIVLWRVFGKEHLPAVKWWFMGGGVLVASVGAYAFSRRPGEREAAVAIDERLALKEKFSTALYVRPMNDPFARATVRDAEVTADNVALRQQFPLTFPRIGYGAIAMIVVAITLALWLKPMDLFGNVAAKKAEAKKLEQENIDAKHKLEQALYVAETMPRSVSEDPKIVADKLVLKDLMKKPSFDDPNRVGRKAQEVLQDVQQALADEAEKTRAKAMEQEKAFAKTFGEQGDYQSPEVKKVDKDLAENKFDKAVQDLSSMASKFDKMNKEEQEKAAADMANLAKKLEKAAEDPKVKQEIADKMQQMGASKDQAQQVAEQIQKAAQGDKAAQQQVADAANQMQKQLQQQIQNLQQQAKDGNPQAQQQAAQLQQQQQAIQQAMQGMQGAANAQAQQQQMSQAAAQMAKAMQQQAQAGQQGQQGQKGQQGQGSSQQQMAGAQQQMQQAIGAMQAAQADAQQVAAAQQNAMKGGQGQQGQGQGKGQGQGEGQQGQPVPAGENGQWQAGDPNQNKDGNGMGGPGVARGGQTREKTAAGFDIKVEHDIGEENDKGHILASTLIKDNQPIIGKSKVGLAQVTEAAQKQASDEVDEDHVSGASRKAAEEYFRTMRQDATQKK